MNEPSPPRTDAATRPLTIIELCLSNGCGGLERYAASLVPALIERGHRVLTVTRPASEFECLSAVAPSLEVRPQRLLPFRGCRKLATLAGNADVIHIHRSADLPLAACAKRLAGERTILVYTRHMAVTRDRRRSPVHRLLHREVDLLLATTDQLAAEARARLPLEPRQVRVLPLGIGPAPPPLADCHAVRPPRGEFLVGCFSRIERAKGQHELLAALAELIRRGIDAATVIAGPVMDHSYEEELQRLSCRLGLAERMRLLGPFEDVRPLMACCDAVVMPSVHETFGLVLVEAMQMGIPVVGSAAGGVPEVVVDRETGLTYPARNPQALAACLERLARNPIQAHSLAEAGRRFVKERFTLASHLDRLEALIRATLR